MYDIDYDLDEARDAVNAELREEALKLLDEDEEYKPCGCSRGCSYCL